MRYSEFKREVEKLGYTFFENKYEVRILDNGACKLIIIDKTDTHVIDPNNVSYITLSHKDKTELLDLSVKLAKTPLAEREEEKRYRLLSVSPMLRKSECGYLLYHREYDKYYTGNTDHWGLVYQTIFTESEIAEMDTTGFQKEEVSND
jgi:hypothetical protein